jgi:putative NADH-flavin reductase
LAQGHAITAFACNSASLSPAASLTIVQGDIVDAAAVERAVSGQDVLLDEYRCRGVSLLY